MVLSAWVLLHVHVSVNGLDFVMVLFWNGVFEYILFVSAWLLLHVYVLVVVLGFVIVLCQGGVFEYILFCVIMVVATRVCLGSRSRLRYCVVSERCFPIHIGL